MQLDDAGGGVEIAVVDGAPIDRFQLAEQHLAVRVELAGDFNPDGEVLLGKLEAVYRRAVDDGYLNAAARIVELQARLTGLPIGRRQAARPAPYDDL
ncbi:MAG: hypothetical protein HYY38_02090 [Rhodospirillales bacterium]|nr:hypothetical protein [Rhodospirillales bacterium]